MSKNDQMAELLAIMAQLRDPQTGCPWDRKQDFASIVPHTLEEAYEVAEAIERGQFDELKDELGDLLFQVVFYSQLGKEQGLFDFSQVVTAICEKLQRRHPHIFATDGASNDETEVQQRWEAIKAAERASKSSEPQPLLADIPYSLPALSRANKLQKRCASVGFDWPDMAGAFAKVKEEILEVEEELAAPNQDHQAIGEELGDLMFALVNVVRKLNHNPEKLLRNANQKFERRFNRVEALTLAAGSSLADSNLEQMDALWDQVKREGF